ncbi:MAG TPA: endonuclease/exonuclease/phosphatase family protein [Candidatus Polarisedimenticolia bacterium]|nr:endonuclease/exonuclease/phosphatase family protein [Candidatus Polarisedimenticolia bacterium]
MPPFPKPSFAYDYSLAPEIQRLRLHKTARGIPDRSAGTLLLATWNIANLGVQQRREKDRRLLAEILSWFDIVAIQEVNSNWTHLRDIELNLLGAPYRVLVSDAAGNNERMAFLYDASKVSPLQLVGEVAFPPSEYAKVKSSGIGGQFKGFDRTPYFATFACGSFTFTLANVHLYYGSESKKDMDRRTLETLAVARWAARESTTSYSFTRDIIALGDFNMPKAAPGDPIYKALTSRGLELPLHSSEVGSAIASDNHYDQIAFFPGNTKNDFTGLKGVFDFDKVVFPDLWQAHQKNFFAYARYFVSDHRPMWTQFRTT